MSLKDKLNRYRPHLTKVTPSPTLVQTTPIGFDYAAQIPDEAQTFVETACGSTHEINMPFSRKWADLQASPNEIDDSYVMVREVYHPASKMHGRYAFDQIHEVIDRWDETRLEHPLSTSHRTAEDLLFFDTETTGLHGGAGNVIFLLGYSRFKGDTVVVRQHFLTAPDAEVALYQSFLLDVKSARHMITYNGKSFDWPQVKTRHTLLRDSVPELPTFQHYDLLHAARRLWRDDLESCRLALIEPEKLHVYRKNDIPGYMAPILYFEYLRDQDPETIQGVLHHNETDVLSLITLYIHLSRLLLDHIRTETASHEERFQIARWFETLGVDTEAIKSYQILARSDHPLRVRAKNALGHLYKRKGHWERSVQIWEECLREFTPDVEHICLELAKIYEHNAKDYEKALYYALFAFETCKKRIGHRAKIASPDEQAYWKRIERLELKMERATKTSQRNQ